MLVESAKEKCFIAVDRSAYGESELLLPVCRLEVHERMLRVQSAVADEVERRTMQTVRTGLCHYVNYRSACASEFRAIGVRRNPELLHHFIRELVGCAIASTGLREEGIIVIGAVDQITRLISANAAKGKIAIGRGRHAAWVLRHARCKQRQIGVAAAVCRQIGNCALIEQR